VEHDACLSISPDGKQIFVYKNENGGDIYVSKKSASEKWSSAKPMEGINSSYWESYASLSTDGKSLYFCSERKGGQGNGDIWVSKRISKNEWEKPVNLGAIVNSDDDEISVFAHPDGKTLFFSSKGHMNMGGYDIFKTVKNEKGEWSQPENMGYPINSLGDDIDFVLNTETGRAYFSSIRPDGEGAFDIYEIDMSNYGLKAGDVKEKSNLSILKGEVISAHDAQKLAVNIKITNKNSGKAETEIHSDEDGNYFIMLPGKNTYELTVEYEGYKPYKLSVDLPLGAHEVATTIKPIVLERAQ
jgi:YHS domain-containing protein